MTITIAVLEISEAAWNEVAESLRDSGFAPTIGHSGEIDMDGFGLIKKPPPPPISPGTIAQRFRNRYVVWRGG